MPEPTTERQLVQRTVRMHTRAAVTNLSTALAPLRAASRALDFKNTELVHHLEAAERAATKAARIVALWDAGDREPSLFEPWEGGS